MSDYNYPASDNAKGTHQREDLITTGDSLEAQIFEQVREVTGSTEGTLIDIGAGEGRYAAYFGSHAADITVIEPDAPRLMKAEANLQSIKAKIHGIHGEVTDAKLQSGSANIVLNIHVLQHIHPDSVTAILDKSADWLKPGGMFVLCFTKRRAADSEYNLSWRDGDQTGYGPIPKSLFEHITKRPVAGSLPVHKLDKAAIKAELEARDLKVIFEEDYTPRLLELSHSHFGRLLINRYKKMNPMTAHKMFKLAKYDKFVDACIVAQKS